MQEYVFGNMPLRGEDVQYLRVKSDYEIDLPVNTLASHKEEYPDMAVITSCRIVRELKSQMEHGLFYKWYLVEDVQRHVEKKEDGVKTRINALETAVLALLGGGADV